MQPSPRAETPRPLFPSMRFSMTSPLGSNSKPRFREGRCRTGARTPWRLWPAANGADGIGSGPRRGEARYRGNSVRHRPVDRFPDGDAGDAAAKQEPLRRVAIGELEVARARPCARLDDPERGGP